MSAATDLLARWLGARLDPAGAEHWAALRARASGPEAEWIMAIALAPRQLGKAPLALEPDERAAAAAARPGWQPELRLDEAARLVLILESPTATIAERIGRLARSADTGELVTLLKGLPLYPDPELHRARAAEGVRSNIRDLFVAVAHRNPYPAEQFDDNAWNQMVLKALFIEVPLHPIHDLDRRANPALSRMLADYAAERRAAGRSVPPELWRALAPRADARGLELLEWMLTTGDARERDAAALGLAAAGPAGSTILARDADRAETVRSGRLTWNDVHG